MVGGAEHFVQDGFQHRRQALAAVLGGSGQRWPAALPEGLVGIAETGWRGDLAVAELAADFIALAAQRRHDLRDKGAGAFNHLLHQLGVGIGIGRQRLQGLRAVQDVEE